MGTQQILLIVLSVIIVGIAIAVGITMFNAQSVNSARSAIVTDMVNFAHQAFTWYKTPVKMGGGGYDTTLDPTAAIIAFIGATQLSNDNGAYTIAGAAGSNFVLFTVAPNESSLTAPQLRVNLASGNTLVTTDGTAPGNPT